MKSLQILIPFAFTFAMIGLGCLGEQGDSCRLDSDCGGGLVCSLSGQCQTPAQVQASFDAGRDVTTPSDTSASSTADVDTSGVTCAPQEGVFEASAAPCPAPNEKRKVTGIVMAPSGHGLEKMASVANQVLENGFNDGEIKLALWVDGTYRAGCNARYVFVEDAATDIGADCTPAYDDAMPLVIPGLVRTEVYDITIDPTTNELRGLVDEEALLASMDPALRDVADSLIELDVDTDGDEIPDKASCILTLMFE